MLKNLITAAALTAALAASLTACGTVDAITAQETASQLYPQGMTITALDATTDGYKVTAETAEGYVYAFITDIDDYGVGDHIAVIMDNNGTPQDISDDHVIDSRYTGL